MRSHGNLSQWSDGYPSEEVIAYDIDRSNHYIGFDEAERVAVVFTFIIGEDPTYAIIEDGEWPDNNPYGTIHRMASTGIHKGMLSRCVDFCLEKCGTIRIDTHSDNLPMLKSINSLGFHRCGIIRVADGSPRIAFQKKKSHADL